MKHIIGSKLNEALLNNYRIYLCGDLKSPQDFQWIHDENVEIGVSFHQEFTADLPHMHTNATEYNFVLSGTVKVLIIDEDKEYTFSDGSLFVIPPNMKYATKSIENTKILFIKNHCGNDKRIVEVSEKLQHWLNQW